MNEMEKKVQSIGVVPVIKLNHPERDAVPAGQGPDCEGGVPVAEVTFRAAGAATAIKADARGQCPEMLVGAGTVLTTEQVDEAMAAGAQFIVTPGMDPEDRRLLPAKVVHPDLPRLHHRRPTITPPTSSAWRSSSSSPPSSPAALPRLRP